MLRRVSISIALCLAVGAMLPPLSTRSIGVGDALGLDSEGSNQEDKSESYAVARVTDHHGLVKYEALPKDKIKERRERLTAAYEVAMKKHDLDKQGLSDGEKEAFVRKPMKPRILLVASNLSKDKATLKADKLQREYAKKQDGVGLFTGK